MDMNSTYAPPINNACVPDIYNRLDADVIERTRVANNQLNMRLLLEQKILSKYKQEAERIMLMEKSRVVQELARITKTIPRVVRFREFDEKFLEKVSQSDLVLGHRKKKNYLAAKNEDIICRRCYIHHLPTKKKFYRYRTPPPPPTILDSKLNHGITGHPNHNHKVTAKSNFSTTQDPTGSDVIIDMNNPDLDEVDSLYSQDQSSKLAERLIPAAEAFTFLKREKWGRERDLNHTLTPRLMPNEIWKHIVKDVCSQCSRQDQGISTNLRHQNVSDVFFRDRAVERKAGTKSRRPSIAITSKPHEINEKYPGNIRKVNSRSNLYRRLSIAKEGNLNGITQPHSPSTSSMFENNTNVSATRRTSTVKTDKLPRSLSRTNSTMMRKNSSSNIYTETENKRNFSRHGLKDSIKNVRLPPIEKEGRNTPAVLNYVVHTTPSE